MAVRNAGGLEREFRLGSGLEGFKPCRICLILASISIKGEQVDLHDTFVIKLHLVPVMDTGYSK